jgi:predicted unusual protein kinase regulating ubiquinone biosynthesis (AarF/ABC1/UbiB family)
VDSLFSKFETEPIATATIAQVHVAYLNDFAKTKVAVKVQVPGSKKLMQMDMRNMLGTPRAFPKSATLFTAPL